VQEKAVEMYEFQVWERRMEGAVVHGASTSIRPARDVLARLD